MICHQYLQLGQVPESGRMLHLKTSKAVMVVQRMNPFSFLNIYHITHILHVSDYVTFTSIKKFNGKLTCQVIRDLVANLVDQIYFIAT